MNENEKELIINWKKGEAWAVALISLMINTLLYRILGYMGMLLGGVCLFFLVRYFSTSDLEQYLDKIQKYGGNKVE